MTVETLVTLSVQCLALINAAKTIVDCFQDIFDAIKKPFFLLPIVAILVIIYFFLEFRSIVSLVILALMLASCCVSVQKLKKAIKKSYKSVGLLIKQLGVFPAAGILCLLATAIWFGIVLKSMAGRQKSDDVLPNVVASEPSNILDISWIPLALGAGAVFIATTLLVISF